MTFLRLRGRIHSDGTVSFRPGYLVSRRRDLAPRGPWHVVAEVRSRSDALLSRTPVVVRTYCRDGLETGSPSGLAVLAEVPLTDEAGEVQFLRLDPTGREPVRLAHLSVAERAPRVEILEAPRGEARGRQKLQWRAEGDPPPVQFRIRYSNDDGQRWQAMAWPTTEREIEIDLDQFPGGDRCRIAILATNGTRSEEAISEPFRVAPKRCKAIIQSPHPNARLASEETILIGHGWWLETMSPELDDLTWISDREGELGRGRSLVVTLSPGHHRLTLRAGRDVRAGETSIEVDVGPQAR
jgi:hypothetical protein